MLSSCIGREFFVLKNQRTPGMCTSPFLNAERDRKSMETEVCLTGYAKLQQEDN